MPPFRLLWALIALGAVLLALPATAAANAIGERYVLASDNPEGLSVILATRVWMQREGTPWVTPGNHADAEWLAVENFGTPCMQILFQGECIIQGGFDKYPTGAGPAGCGTGSTGGDVKMFWFSLDEHGGVNCSQDIVIGSTDGHKLKISRCTTGGDGNWCFYYDGNNHFHASVPGMGDSAPRAGNGGEFTCDSCMTNATTMRASYGGSTLPWQISDKGAESDSDWETLVNGDTHTDITEGCSGSSLSHWVVNDASPTSLWDIYWENGGTNC
jgi:hypothetical protein